MNKHISRVCIVGVICFIVGILFGIVTMTVLRTQFVVPKQRQREREAYTFFYKTMNELLQGTYNPEEGSVRPDALNIFKDYEPRLGGKCQTRLSRLSGGEFGGLVFFPSGDIFGVTVWQTEGRQVLAIYPENWENLWMESLKWYGTPNTN